MATNFPRHPISLSALGETYHIKLNAECTVLKEWLSAQYTLNDFETTLFEQIYEDRKDLVQYYNEEELKIELISFLFFLANIEVKEKIKVFYERPLKAIVGNYQLSVIADCLVATPAVFNKPKNPYFFLQEFKKGKGDDKDPEAQMLAAMLIAQAQNNDNKPIYGSYITGANWWFCTLLGNNYCVSRDYSSVVRADLLQIIYIIRHIKTMILDR